MRLLIVLAVVAALVVAFVLVRPNDDDGSEAEPTTPTATATVPAPPPTAEPAPTTTEAEPAAPEPTRLVVTVRGGRPVGGIVRATANQDEPVVLIVRADVADHVHVHGYDLMSDVGPGRPARMQFRATLTGRFEIELEDRAQQIAQLTVLP